MANDITADRMRGEGLEKPFNNSSMKDYTMEDHVERLAEQSHLSH